MGLKLRLKARPCELLIYRQVAPGPYQAAYGPDLPWAHYQQQAKQAAQHFEGIAGTLKHKGPHHLSPICPVIETALTSMYAKFSAAAELLRNSRSAQPLASTAVGRGQGWRVVAAPLYQKAPPCVPYSDDAAFHWAVLAARL